MKKGLYILLPLVLALSGCTRSGQDAPAKPVNLDKGSAEKIIKEIEKERADTKEWLRSSPTSYYAAIDRIDFDQKDMLTVGRADGNDLRLNDADIEPHHLRIAVDGDRFRVECVDAKAHFLVKDEAKREAIVEPSYIQVGRFRLRLSHQRFPALIVFDPKRLQLDPHKLIAYFPIDLAYRYELPLQRYPKPEQTIIMSTRGNRRKAERVGWVDFFVGEVPCRLEAVRLLEPGAGENDLSIYFQDALSAKEAYPLGRYVDLKKLESGRYLLDFNQAYNPSCAFSEYYNCPVPPKANTLKVAIRAGEMTPTIVRLVDPELPGRAEMK